MRVLIRLGMDRAARNLNIFAVMLDLVLHHDLRDQVHRFIDHRLKRAQIIAEGSRLLLRAHAEMDAAFGENIERRDAFGDLDRMVHRGRQADDAVPDAEPRGLAGEEGEEGLGRRHMRILGERGVLDRPDGVEAHRLGEQRLLDDLVETARFVRARGVHHLRFVNDREFHGCLILSAIPYFSRA